VGVPALAVANGGYFPTAWGWAAILLLLVTGSALLIRDEVALGRLDLAFLAAFAAFVGWIALSTAWSVSAAQPVLETERGLVYLLGLAAVVLVVDRSAIALAGGTCIAVVGIGTYALATRLFPGEVGSYRPGAGYQLAEPIGYWNALAILTALGLLLALGFTTADRGPLRAAGGASLPVLATTLYYTFSRGAWLALAAGLAVVVALDPSRLRAAARVAALAVLPALGVWIASRPGALTHEGARVAAARHDGHRVAVDLALLAALSGAAALLLPRFERRLTLGPTARRALAVGLAAIAAGAVAAALAGAGGPAGLVGRGYDAFAAPLRPSSGDLNRRLVSLSGNGRREYWRVALDEYRDHPVLGGGAGSYERFWVRDRPVAFYARDAHSLYLEALAELGPFGLLLLLAALCVPLVAAVRARAQPLVPALAAAYIAFLVHAGLDWDWEMPAVGLAGLACGAALCIAARPPSSANRVTARLRLPALAALLPLAAFVFVIHVSNVSLAAAQRAQNGGRDAEAARQANRARRWTPWSYQPWQVLGETQLARGDLADARRSLHAAIRRDPENWSAWLDLALASNGAARNRALARARALDPLGPELTAVQATS
jgi:hypothetical protein